MEKWWLLLKADFDMLDPELQRHIYNCFYCFAYKEIIFFLKDHALAEDIIQEAFLKITAKHHQLLKPESAKQWAKRLIRNQMLDTLRRKTRYEMGTDNVYKENKIAARVETAVSVEYTVEEAFRNQVLHETIVELKEDYRSLLLKFYMEERPIKDIATESGVSEQVIAQRLVRARKNYWVNFQENGLMTTNKRGNAKLDRHICDLSEQMEITPIIGPVRLNYWYNIRSC
ncbi:RNA polymerase sigma factor [Paenibacillus sp. TC-CSREp1]|uniref:RNA polymerase sigma factor n=1 Tax=Paenibacillus sp. TC-CSREp1 TaxID=3410089 RepID=UPI003D00EBD8